MTLGQLDICYAISSLSHFSCCPCEGHIRRLFRVWGYLKKFPNKSIGICAQDLVYEEPLEEFRADFEDQYEYASEEIDLAFPEPKGKLIATSIFFDSDHVHDTETRRSISGVFIVVGSTPISWMSKHQGAVTTSTYLAEFCAIRLATEEAITIQYMPHSLGIM